MNFKSFYTKYRLPILATTAVVTSVFLAYAIDRFVLKRGKKVKLKNPNPKKILFVGDSQTAIQTPSGQKVTYTYPNLLRKQFPDKQIDVLAIGGKRTSWMLENLPNQLKDNKYDRVYIYGGGNDTSSNVKVDTTLSNIQKMVDLSNENGADVYVNTGWKLEGEKGKFANPYFLKPTIYVKTPQEWMPLVAKRKELQERIPNEIKNANFILPYDLQQKTTDGVHPTAEGHKMVAEFISKTLT